MPYGKGVPSDGRLQQAGEDKNDLHDFCNNSWDVDDNTLALKGRLYRSVSVCRLSRSRSTVVLQLTKNLDILEYNYMCFVCCSVQAGDFKDRRRTNRMWREDEPHVVQLELEGFITNKNEAM